MLYFDYAATTPMKFAPAEQFNLKNSHSVHMLGFNSYQAIEQARKDIMGAVGFKSGILLFGGNATSLIATVMQKIKNKNGVIYCNPYEHEAIYDWADAYQLDPKAFKKDDVVCQMLMNNITGTVFDLTDLSKQVKESEAFLFVDCTAAIGHVEFPENFELMCDAWVCSAHKFYGPQNAGMLWLSDRFAEYLGVKSEKDIYVGTLPIFNILAMRDAFLKYHNKEYIRKMIRQFHDLQIYMYNLLEDYRIYSYAIMPANIRSQDNGAINACCIENINADALATYLSSREIYVGLGHSACAAESDYRVLKALECANHEASCVIRVSFGDETTKDDIEALAKGIYDFKQMFVS